MALYPEGTSSGDLTNTKTHNTPNSELLLSVLQSPAVSIKLTTLSSLHYTKAARNKKFTKQFSERKKVVVFFISTFYHVN